MVRAFHCDIDLAASEVTATPRGTLPTGIVAVTVWVAGSITDTVSEPEFAT
jgi:hypothetical protein